MLREFTGGASLLMVEWQLLQQLAQQAALLFDDLDVYHAADLTVPHPRRWWEPRWLRGKGASHAGQSSVVHQVYLGGTVEPDEEESSATEWAFLVDVYLLGRDGVLRWDIETLTFPRSEYPEPPLEIGDHGPHYRVWLDLELGAGAEPVELQNMGFTVTEQLLQAFAELGTSTRDVLRERIARLHEVGRLCAADPSGQGETNPPRRA